MVHSASGALHPTEPTTSSNSSSQGNNNNNQTVRHRAEFPFPSRQPSSEFASPTGVYTPYSVASQPSAKHRFKSTRLRGDYDKPWLKDPALKKTRWNNLIVGTFMSLGIVGAGLICYFTSAPFKQKDYCLVYEDDFKTLNKDIWSHEVQLNGFGTGAFDWTTTDERNSYIDDQGLHIVPTLTTEDTDITSDQIYANYTLSLDDDGSCTGEKNSSECVLRSNPDKGRFIPPVRSARLTTKGKKSIRYGMVEVEAKLPKGDWLWPAIWMMPEESVYGVWPRSGEIDIMESRGNERDYDEGGRNYYYGSLHWGPTSDTDAYWKTTNAKKLRRGDYASGYHTYGIQWDDSYIYFYIDSKVHQILFIGFHENEGLYERGNFAEKAENDTLLDNPWAMSNSTTGNAPFDQEFYLILNVAVGGTNGFFPDNVGEKPWVNGAKNARWSFWEAKDRWLPSWGEGDERGMTVRKVRMWRAGACGSEEL